MRCPPRPGSSCLARQLHLRSEGIPFFVEELAAALLAEGALDRGPVGLELSLEGALSIPESVRDAVHHRLAGLPPKAKSVLELAAVLGSEFELEAIRLLEPGEEALVEAVDEGILVEPSPGRMAFRHALTRDAVYLTMPSPRRRAHHRRVARLLDGQRASDVYVNFIGDEGRDRVVAGFGEENFGRLARVKARYDPDNVFRSNHNPAGSHRRLSRTTQERAYRLATGRDGDESSSSSFSEANPASGS